MPTEFYYPISSATHDLPSGHDGWTNVGGANKNVSTRPGGGRSGPVTHDDSGAYVTCTTAVAQAFNADWPGPMAVWDGVLTVRARAASSASVGFAVGFVNAAGNITSPLAGSLNNPAYGDMADTDASGSRPGGGAWTAADFQNDQTTFLRIGSAGGGITLSFTSLWGSISYTPAGGGFIFLFGLAGAAALPHIGRLVDLTQFQRFLAWRRLHHPRHTLLTGTEVQQAWRELRAYRYPVFSR